MTVGERDRSDRFSSVIKGRGVHCVERGRAGGKERGSARRREGRKIGIAISGGASSLETDKLRLPPCVSIVHHVISCRGAALIDARPRQMRKSRRRRGDERRGRRETVAGMEDVGGGEPTAIGNWPDDID